MDLWLWIASGAVVLVFALVAFGLAHAARFLPNGIPRVLKILVSGTIVPFVLFAIQYNTYIDQTFLEWITTRPFRAYVAVPATFLAGCYAAWFVLRDRSPKLDIRTFN